MIKPNQTKPKKTTYNYQTFFSDKLFFFLSSLSSSKICRLHHPNDNDFVVDNNIDDNEKKFSIFVSGL